jgi:hypothetical protein
MIFFRRSPYLVQAAVDQLPWGQPAYSDFLSVQREELLRLVEELPENEVPVVLDAVRRHLRAVRDGSWPPAWRTRIS